MLHNFCDKLYYSLFWKFEVCSSRFVVLVGFKMDKIKTYYIWKANGRRKCKNTGVIYLTKSEYNDFTKGERIFRFESNTSKVKLEDKVPVKI